jgi:hypothetical protein
MPDGRGAIRERRDERDDDRVAQLLQGVVGPDPGDISVQDPGEPDNGVVVVPIKGRSLPD